MSAFVKEWKAIDEIENSDLTNPNAVSKLMESSRSKAEWKKNSEKVKASNGGHYPSYWYNEIYESGLEDRTRERWV